MPPAIDAASIAPGPHNVLSAVVTVRARRSDSVAVWFRLEAADLPDSATAAVPAAGDATAVPVLGLLPASRYALRAVAFGPGGRTVGEPLELTTGPLPSDLPTYTTEVAAPSPGYVVFAIARYGIVIDNVGRVVWYRRFDEGPGLNFVAQPNGHYAARPPTTDMLDVEPWVELDPLGNVRRSLGCARGLTARLHDLLIEPDGGYWILCDETRPMDLSGLGGAAGAQVTGTVVQHVGADGALRFEWSPFDHFAITDLPPADRAGSAVNWTHGNAFDFDADGNLLVSFRSLGEITKIHRTTGAVLWRLGGLANQFAFVDASAPAFARQHGVRSVDGGQLLLLDNSGDPNESRGERYVLDEGARTARLLRSYSVTPPVITQIGGSVQGLPGGRALVSFGTAGRVEEYDTAGSVIWRITGNLGYVFRAQRIRSLYAPGVGTPR
jgi:hypothetical protein